MQYEIYYFFMKLSLAQLWCNTV